MIFLALIDIALNGFAPMLNCCLFKLCSSSSSSRESVIFPSQPIVQSTEPPDVAVQCGRCKSDQSLPAKAIVMVCLRCHCVNRLRLDPITNERRVSFIDCDVGECELIPNSPSIFQLGDNADGRSIPTCSVCLDGPGDMVLENCGHGGICEDCARHIALNQAVGGAHCPLDKQEILKILRIGELNDQFVKARQCDLPEVPLIQPPRVPAPVGLRKEKGGRNESPCIESK